MCACLCLCVCVPVRVDLCVHAGVSEHGMNMCVVDHTVVVPGASGETFTQEELDATLAMLIPEEEELEKRVSGQSFAEDLLRFEPYDEDSEEEEFS